MSNNGNNGKLAESKIDPDESFEAYQRLFAETFAACYNTNAGDVTAMPMENLVIQVTGGKKAQKKVTLTLPRNLADQFRWPLDDPRKDLMVFVHIPRSLVDFVSQPANLVDAKGKKLA